MSTPPGWYGDPYKPGQRRWWDGQAWTHHVSAVPQQQAAQQPQDERSALANELARLRAELIEARDHTLLQEVGLYDYSHPLDSSVEYRDALKALRADFKATIKTGDAVVGTKRWAINGSTVEGAKMVTDFSKLLLKAYNAEAEAAVKSLRPYALASAKSRLDKTRKTIARLGKSMSLRVTDEYHAMRIRELELTADYRAKLEDEKEQQREVRARLREEAAARKEFEQEQARLQKELSHYENVIAKLKARGDGIELRKAEAKLAELNRALDGVIERAANIRAGYVYVISNLGAFGPGVVKIGMTRRLEPLDRVRELGGASVPFRFDVHAIIFSEDAVGLENDVHRRFADRKLNLVNLRREFFYVTPREVERALIDLRGSLMSFTEEVEALEWNQSETVRRSRGMETAPPTHGSGASPEGYLTT